MQTNRPILASFSAVVLLCVALAPTRLRAQTQSSVLPSVLLSVEGKVELKSDPDPKWNVVQANQPLAIGDRLRTGPRSRATLLLSDQTTLRLNELTLLEIRPGASNPKRPSLDLKAGSTYFFNRGRPSETDFRTPVASGAIRGTEFHLAVDEATGRTVVTLLDGDVALTNSQGDLALAGGEQATVEPGHPPEKTAVINALRIIQWCLYYPAILDPKDVGLTTESSPALAESLQAYRRGDPLQALSRYPESHQPANDAERIYHAALLLAVGQVPAAEATLQTLQAPAPPAQAMRRLIASVNTQEPLAQAERPANRPPATATEWMAESYHQQAQAQIERALDAARQAARQAPEFGFAAVRVAELEFSLGRTTAALQELDRAPLFSEHNAQALALKGFLLAARNQTHDALAAFNQAIARDGALGNAWLGRGLSKIRLGQRQAGLDDLQVAATVEPQRAALRSYLGKAYSHAHDNAHAEKELKLARRLDPADPTAWLYSALVAQEENRINDAVRDLEQSKERNDHRSLYRSRLLLDQDRSVRSANLASMYRDAGLAEVSVREATHAVNDDYANYSAHLFLANSYDAIRDPRQINLRYETPWLSELLVANLLAPVGAVSLSQNISQQEYSRFFEGNRLGLSSSTEYFSSGAWVQRGSQFGTLGQSSYALDVDYRTDPGQRPNNDFEQLTLSGKFKQQLTPADSVYVQVLGLGGDSGDLAQYYDQASASGVQRVKETQAANVFVGYHHEWGPGSHTLLLAGRLDDQFRFRGRTAINNLTRNPSGQITGGFSSLYNVDYESDFAAYTAELQQIWERGAHTLIAGGRYQNGQNETTATTPTAQDLQSDLERASAYAYYHWQIVSPLKLIAGVSYDHLDFPENNDLPPFSARQRTEDQLSPKAGFYYVPLTNTTLRGIYSRSLGGLFYDSSVRLEPTQIGGFNQAFRSVIPESVAGLVPGSAFETFGLALDQKLFHGTYIGVAVEQLDSDAKRMVGAFDLQFPGPAIPSGLDDRIEFQERSLHISIHQLIGTYWSIGASYRLTDADLNEHFRGLTPALATAMNRDWSATLHQVRAAGTLNLPCGFFATAEAVWSQQSNHGYSPDQPGDDFWQGNLYVGYRLLQRRLDVRLGLLNLTDANYRLNPLTLYSELARERTLAARLQFHF